MTEESSGGETTRRLGILPTGISHSWPREVYERLKVVRHQGLQFLAMFGLNLVQAIIDGPTKRLEGVVMTTVRGLTREVRGGFRRATSHGRTRNGQLIQGRK